MAWPRQSSNCVRLCARLSLSLKISCSKIGCAEAPTPQLSSNKSGTIFGSNGALGVVRHSKIGNCISICLCARLSLSLKISCSKIGCAEAPTPQLSSNKSGTIFGSNGALGVVRHSKIGNCISICLCAHLSLSLAVAEDRMRFGNVNQTSLLPLRSPFAIFAFPLSLCAESRC